MSQPTLEQTRAKLEEVRARSFNWRTKLEAPLPARAPAPGVSAASFKVRKGHAASNSEEFTEDFMHRLEDAERRDHQTLAREQVTADALDALVLESAAPDENDETGEEHSVMPSPQEVKRVVEMFWKSPAAKRSNQRDSSMAVAGSFIVSYDALLDENAFCKMLALIQKPALGTRKGHSPAQISGWHAAFHLMDFDGSGSLTRDKVKRFLDRRVRSLAEARKAHEEQVQREELGGKAIAAELQSRVDMHLHAGRAKESALASLEEVVRDGATFDALFPLVMALAPPFFGCERATLWIARDIDAERGDEEEWDDDGTQAEGSFSRGASFKSTSAASFKSSAASFASAKSSSSWQGDSVATAQRGRVIFSRFPSAGSSFATAADGGDGTGAAPATNEVTLAVNSLSIAGTAVSAAEPQLVANAYTDARFDTSFDERTGFVTRSIMCVPLVDTHAAGTAVHSRASRVAAPTLGCLQLVNKLPKDAMPHAEFNFRDLRAGSAFSALLSEAILAAAPREAQQHVRQVEEYAAEQERLEKRRAVKERRRKTRSHKKRSHGA